MSLFAPLVQHVRTCRSCGCTDDRACPGGCFWVEADLCSACAELTEADIADAELEPEEIACPASPVSMPHQIIWTTPTAGHCVRCREEFHA